MTYDEAIVERAAAAMMNAELGPGSFQAAALADRARWGFIARAALAAAEAAAWQPIATAPRDGTWLLCWGNEPLPHVMQWHKAYDAWVLVSDQHGEPPIDPTHWRALPAGPKA